MTRRAANHLFGLFINVKVVYVQRIDFSFSNGARRHGPHQFYVIRMGGFFNIFVTAVAGIGKYLLRKKIGFFEIFKDRRLIKADLCKEIRVVLLQTKP